MYIVISEADIVVESAENNKDLIIRFYDNERTVLDLNMETAKDLIKKLNYIVSETESHAPMGC